MVANAITVNWMTEKYESDLERPMTLPKLEEDMYRSTLVTAVGRGSKESKIFAAIWVWYRLLRKLSKNQEQFSII